MQKRRFAGLILAAIVGFAAAQAAAGRHPISGREYARPMGVSGAPWLDREEREAEERPTRALEIMNVRPGMTVADIGAGSGYFTERLARLVGPSGRVYASDIQQGMLDLLQKRLAREKLGNVVPVLAEATNPRLPDAAIDLALMVDVYHELGDPRVVLGHIKKSLTPGGRLVLIEYKGEDPTIPIQPLHKMTVAQAKLEVEHEGYVLATVDSSLPRQHVLVFRTKEN